MNNQQFRRLLQPSSKVSGGDAPGAVGSSTHSSDATKRSSLIPMTPRNVKGGTDVDFARQVRERNTSFKTNRKFKSATPKGVKYAAGYTDRAKARAEAADAEDDKAGRIKALEEQMKLGQISQETFESLKDQIAGGDVSSTHLVKGLDRKLLERVRRGEDVLGTREGTSETAPVEIDVDKELLMLEEKDFRAVKRGTAQKRGSMAPPPPKAGVKRSRDDIMAELKAQRKVAAEAKATVTLDASKWRKLVDNKSRTEIDHKGREVLTTVDEDGVVKKKIRKVPAQSDEKHSVEMLMPDADRPTLGADAKIPEGVQHQQPGLNANYDDDHDDDIFEGVGTEYNPLGNESGSDEDSEDEADDRNGVANSSKPSAKPAAAMNQPQASIEESTSARISAAPRSYFKDTTSIADEAPKDRLAGVEDFLKKAAKLEATWSDAADLDGGDDEETARLRKRAEMLGQRDRDMEDMDMGFGESRFDDGEEEGEGKKTRLSEWKGGADDGGREDDKKGEKKKRKPKKRKGDSSNMNDIMRVIEGRKGGLK